MTDNVSNELLLEHLKSLQSEAKRAQERHNEVMYRLGVIEIARTSLVRDQANMFSDQASDRQRMDRLVARLDRIERRLDLAESGH